MDSRLPFPGIRDLGALFEAYQEDGEDYQPIGREWHSSPLNGGLTPKKCSFLLLPKSFVRSAGGKHLVKYPLMEAEARQIAARFEVEMGDVLATPFTVQCNYFLSARHLNPFRINIGSFFANLHSISILANIIYL